jgi:hypothetical protein
VTVAALAEVIPTHVKEIRESERISADDACRFFLILASLVGKRKPPQRGGFKGN